jgi:hypothetical protein
MSGKRARRERAAEMVVDDAGRAYVLGPDGVTEMPVVDATPEMQAGFDAWSENVLPGIFAECQRLRRFGLLAPGLTGAELVEQALMGVAPKQMKHGPDRRLWGLPVGAAARC